MTHRIPARTASLGTHDVRRVLPHHTLRKVGPWVFLDHFGPHTRVVSRVGDVRPHPHCGISTVSYLFEGGIEHRDSVGGHAVVRPGEVHWMRAGHGVVHSERAPAEDLGQSRTGHGLQLWCAHPDGEEDQEPAFGSWSNLPALDLDGHAVELLAGNGWGHASPVSTTSNLVYAIATLPAGARIPLPDHAERCVYPVAGTVALGGEASEAFEMLVADPGAQVVEAVTDATVAILGGDPIGKRFMWWNLVHSDKARLAEQAERWRRREFPAIPGDDVEFIPAPTGPDVARLR
ncbi:MAG: pirin family protein [Myxococcota bacterium]